MLNLLLLRAFCKVALLTLGNISANRVPTIVDSVTKRPLHMFCWKLSDWGQELFSHFSRNFKRKLLSCNPAGKRPSRMNNWWCEMDAFPSVESRSNCELYYLEWRVRCVLSATLQAFFFLPLLALYLQPFSFFCLFSFPFPNFPVTYSLKSKTPLLKSALTPLIIKFGRIYLMMRVCCQSCR